MKKETLRVNELAEQIGAEFKPGEPLSVVGLTVSKKDLVAEVLTKSMDINGVEVCFDAHRDKFVWTISDECHYGPDANDLRLEYGYGLFDYDEEGYLLSPFRVLDGKDIHKVYGFDFYGNRSYCIPVVLTEAIGTIDNRYYDRIAVRPETNSYGSSLLYIVEWGGANRKVVETIDYESLTLPNKADQKIFVYRVQSNGGKQGIDYYVLPTCYSKNPILRRIVDRRDEQYETKMKAGEEQFAHKVNLVQAITERLTSIYRENGCSIYLSLDYSRADESAKACYVDKLEFNFNEDELLAPPTLDCSLECLEERYEKMDETGRVYRRLLDEANDQLCRWKWASLYFPTFYKRIRGLGGTMSVNLYKMFVKLPSLTEAGKFAKETYLINAIQLPMLDKKLKEYEEIADKTES